MFTFLQKCAGCSERFVETARRDASFDRLGCAHCMGEEATVQRGRPRSYDGGSGCFEDGIMEPLPKWTRRRTEFLPSLRSSLRVRPPRVPKSVCVCLSVACVLFLCPVWVVVFSWVDCSPPRRRNECLRRTMRLWFVLVDVATIC